VAAPRERLTPTRAAFRPSSRLAVDADAGWPLAAVAAQNDEVAGAPDPAAILTAGSVIVGDVLIPAGFTFHLTSTGHSSGGAFASGRFTKGSQYLEFHFRHSLGLVVYGWDDATISHADYLRGVDKTGAYPGYSADRLDGFRHLALDLAGPLCGFRDGDREGYEHARRTASEAAVRKLPCLRPARALSRRAPSLKHSSRHERPLEVTDRHAPISFASILMK